MRLLLDPTREVEQQACRRFVDPVHVVENQHQRPFAGQLEQHGSDLLENATLLRQGSRGDRSRARQSGLGPASQQVALSCDHCAGLGDQTGPRNEDVHQVRRDLGNDVFRHAQEVTQSPCVLLGGNSFRDAIIDLAGQHSEQFTERQVGIADAGLRVAGSDGHQQLLLLLLRNSRELERQAGLAEARFAGDKADPAPALQCIVQESAQAAEFFLA